MPGGVTIKVLHPQDAEFMARIPALAELRITVFREFPYLYDGSLAYEEKYLATYRECATSIVALALDGDRVVGASTALPLSAETANIKSAFAGQPYVPTEIFYCGESILLPAYRGRGVYREFFTARERHAREFGGFKWMALCAVVRPATHPRRPSNYVPLDAIWQKFGYIQQPDLRASFVWLDLDETAASPKEMVFWLKPL